MCAQCGLFLKLGWRVLRVPPPRQPPCSRPFLCERGPLTNDGHLGVYRVPSAFLLPLPFLCGLLSGSLPSKRPVFVQALLLACGLFLLLQQAFREGSGFAAVLPLQLLVEDGMLQLVAAEDVELQLVAAEDVELQLVAEDGMLQLVLVEDVELQLVAAEDVELQLLVEDVVLQLLVEGVVLQLVAVEGVVLQLLVEDVVLQLLVEDVVLQLLVEDVLLQLLVEDVVLQLAFPEDVVVPAGPHGFLPTVFLPLPPAQLSSTSVLSPLAPAVLVVALQETFVVKVSELLQTAVASLVVTA